MRQRSMFDRAGRHYREIAILRLELQQLAHRLRLHVEAGFDEPGETNRVRRWISACLIASAPEAWTSEFDSIR